MSSRSWQNCLRQTLKRLKKPDRPTRLAIVGIGHELRGDDGVGITVARILLPLAHKYPWLLVVDGGPAPENHTGHFRRFRPDLVVFIDAASMDSVPGTIRWLDWRSTDGVSASTHTLPIHVLSAYLTSEFHCEVALIGVQPACTAIGTPLSAQVRQASRRIRRGFYVVLQYQATVL